MSSVATRAPLPAALLMPCLHSGLHRFPCVPWTQKTREAALQNKAIAIGDAKHWDRPLDVNLRIAETRSATRTRPTRSPSTSSTAARVRMETDLNARVYALFDLTPAEIAIIEASTKYKYGEV